MKRNLRLSLILTAGLAALVTQSAIFNSINKEENKGNTRNNQAGISQGHSESSKNYQSKEKSELIYQKSGETIIMHDNKQYILDFHKDGRVKFIPYKQK